MCVAALLCILERGECLEEMKRVAVPGSLVLMTVWNKDQPRFVLSGKEITVPWAGKERYYYLFTKAEFRKLLEEHGFEIISVRGSHDKAFKLFPRNIIALARVPKSGRTFL